MPKVSIVIRSHNDSAFISDTLKALLSQDFKDFEIISCDDASTDGTAEIIASFPQVIHLERPEGRYVPGKTLNRAIPQCHGEIIVFNNADAVPCRPDYLTKLLEPLLSDSSVIAVYGNQLPRDDAQALVRKDSERAFGDGKISANWRNFFSLASSAIRRQALLDYPFDEGIQYSEDIEWTWRSRQRGERIVYCPEALVKHSHNYTIHQLWVRFFNEGRADGRIYGEIPSLAVCCRRFVMECLRDYAYLLKRGAFNELLMPPIRRYIQIFAHRKGTRDYLLSEGGQ